MFPAVTFDAINVTDDDLLSGPAMTEAAKLDGLLGLASEIQADADQADIDSVDATLVRVFMYSDVVQDIGRAAALLETMSRSLNALTTDDTGTVQSGTQRALERVLGHRPEHEDALQYMRAVGYKFT